MARSFFFDQGFNTPERYEHVIFATSRVVIEDSEQRTSLVAVRGKLIEGLQPTAKSWDDFGMWTLEFWEMASYVVTVVGLPFAIFIFIWEQRKERQLEEEEIYQRLSDEYAEFSKLLLENADLYLTSRAEPPEPLAAEQEERKRIIFDILISLFERAFILVYEESMTKQTARLWASWEDYIRYWCQRADFRDNLKSLLEGEDPDFQQYMLRIADQQRTPIGGSR